MGTKKRPEKSGRESVDKVSDQWDNGRPEVAPTQNRIYAI